MPLPYSVLDVNCCASAFSERRVALLIQRYGNLVQEYVGHIVIAKVDFMQMYTELIHILEDRNCSGHDARAVSRDYFKWFRLPAMPDYIHADAIGYIACESQHWSGGWLHVCRMLRWERNDIVARVQDLHD